MELDMNFSFYKNETAPVTPTTRDKIYVNAVGCDLMELQVSGTYTGGEFICEARTNIESADIPWVPVKVYNHTTGKMQLELTENGIYDAIISGYQEFRVRIVSIASGSVTIFGRPMKEV